MELDESLRLADEVGDVRAGKDLAAERAALLNELQRAAGLAGRSRVFSDDAERARVNVTRTIRQALNRILVVDPNAGRHLIATVRTGAHCVYQPDH